MSTDSYIVKWKGQQSGPYTLRQLQEKAASREIKGIYEVLDGGEWKTVRVFLREVTKASSEPALPVFDTAPASSPPALPPPAAASERGFGGAVPARSWSEEPVWESAASLRGGPEEYKQPDERIVLVYAGFWTRLLASILDISLVVVLPLGLVSRFSPGSGSGAFVDSFRDLGALGVVIVLLGSVLTWIYFAALESSAWGATLGKKIVGLVVSSEDGERISFQTATIRYFSKFLSGLMVGAGFFLAAFTRKKQAFHDLLSRSTVNLAVRESRILQGAERTNEFNYHG